MTGRAWIAAIALGLSLTNLAYAQPVNGNASGNAPAAESQQQPAADAEPVSPPSIQDLLQRIARALETANDQADSAEEQERAKRDLAAQEDMAKWARWMLGIGFAEALITGTGVFLVWRTLLHTRDAAFHAGEAVKEARNATTAARDIGEAQTRAYLYCKSASFKRERNVITAILDIANAGQSPASSVSIEGDLTINEVIGRRSMPRVGAWLASEKESSPCPPIIANGMARESIFFFWDGSFPTQPWESPEPNPDDDVSRRQIFDDGNELRFDLQIKWSDVFGQRHEFGVSLDAIINAHPLEPAHAKSRAGKLHLRMDDARHRVIGPQPEQEQSS